jgi:pyruvate dehydrogenase E1 component alpha subunit
MAEATSSDPIAEEEVAVSKETLEGFSPEELRGMLRDMLFYRRFEEKAEEAYAIGKIGGFCHLHIGQEGVAVGGIKPLRPDDYVISGYREHTQALAKGLDPNAVMAELYGRETGVSRGNGGSMHLFGRDHGFMGGHGIVGGQIPLATGFGWAIKYKGGDQVCVCFMGDAAVNQGAFHESKNMAAVWDLPVIYVVENNHYGMGTAFGRVSDVELHERAQGYGMPVTTVNGQDVLATYRHFEKVIAEVRDGSGPQFVEVNTYRFKGHSMSDPVSGTYRSKEEVEAQMHQGDPIEILRARMMDADLLTEAELKAMDEEVRALCQEAADFADNSPFPGPENLYEDVYAEVNERGRLFFDGREGR